MKIIIVGAGEAAEVIEAVALETSGITGKPLKKISFPKGAILVCIMKEEEIIIPTGESVVAPGDKVIIFARQDAVKKLEKLLTVGPWGSPFRPGFSFFSGQGGPPSITSPSGRGWPSLPWAGPPSGSSGRFPPHIMSAERIALGCCGAVKIRIHKAGHVVERL